MTTPVPSGGMDLAVAGRAREDDRRHERGLGVVGALLQPRQPAGRYVGVVIEEHRVSGVDVVQSQVAGLVPREEGVATHESDTAISSNGLLHGVVIEALRPRHA